MSKVACVDGGLYKKREKRADSSGRNKLVLNFLRLR